MLGAHNVNDAVEVRAHAHATLSFLNTHARACVGFVLRAGKFWPLRSRAASVRGVSTKSASGVAQQLKKHNFDDGDAASRRQRKGA
eukprot:5994516-Pleurochrysis_carterae.AAC.1